MGNCFERSQSDDEYDDPRSNFVNPTSSVLFTQGTSRVCRSGNEKSVSNSADHSQIQYWELVIVAVFMGRLDENSPGPSKPGSGTMVAVRQLEKQTLQDRPEWLSEVSFLGRLSHPNLVRLLGYCWKDEGLLLVYEIMQKRSLENHLFRRIAVTQPLSWDIRLKIAIGAARGLAFLHSSERTIIYRAFKASNILLDGNYNAKIANFGFAKLGPAGEMSHVTTRIIGTNGYAAPEYLATGHLYVKSDVFGFGVVLLEMLTGQRALDFGRSRAKRYLVDWMKPILCDNTKIMAVMDARIKGQYSSKEAHLVAQLTLKCLETEQINRPAMREIVEVLEQIQAIKEKRKKGKIKNLGLQNIVNTIKCVKLQEYY